MKNLLLIISLLSTLQTFAQIDLIPYRKGDKWGYANRQKEIMIEPQFEEVGLFTKNTIAWVRSGKKYGYINNEGKFVIEAQFDKTGDFYLPYRSKILIASVIKGDSLYLINTNGEQVYHKFISKCGGTVMQRAYFRKHSIGNKIGIWRNDWKRVVNDSVYFEIDSSVFIWDKFIENGQGLAAVLKDGKWGIINQIEDLIVDYIYDDITVVNLRPNSFFLTKKNNLYGFHNKYGKLVIEPKYKNITFLYHGLAKVWLTNNFWFYIDTKGTEYYEP